MLSKRKAKFLKSLQLKKYRKEYGKFTVEGVKTIKELIGTEYVVDELFVTDEIIEEAKAWFPNIAVENAKKDEISAASFLKTNEQAIAVVNFLENELTVPDQILYLDGINDPGNLGTIIRTALWFGVKQIVCSLDTVDVYNPKVITSSKGGVFGVNIRYIDLKMLTDKLYEHKVIGADMNGITLNGYPIPQKWVLVMGSEANGISNENKKYITENVSIHGAGEMESLNVGVAAGIILNKLCN